MGTFVKCDTCASQTDLSVNFISQMKILQVRLRMFEQANNLSKFKNPFNNVNLSLVVILLAFTCLHISVQGIALPRGLLFPYISMGLEVPSMMASFVYTNPEARAHMRRRWNGLSLREDHRGRWWIAILCCLDDRWSGMQWRRREIRKLTTGSSPSAEKPQHVLVIVSVSWWWQYSFVVVETKKSCRNLQRMIMNLLWIFRWRQRSCQRLWSHVGGSWNWGWHWWPDQGEYHSMLFGKAMRQDMKYKFSAFNTQWHLRCDNPRLIMWFKFTRSPEMEVKAL